MCREKSDEGNIGFSVIGYTPDGRKLWDYDDLTGMSVAGMAMDPQGAISVVGLANFGEKPTDPRKMPTPICLTLHLTHEGQLAWIGPHEGAQRRGAGGLAVALGDSGATYVVGRTAWRSSWEMLLMAYGNPRLDGAGTSLWTEYRTWLSAREAERQRKRSPAPR